MQPEFGCPLCGGENGNDYLPWKDIPSVRCPLCGGENGNFCSPGPVCLPIDAPYAGARIETNLALDGCKVAEGCPLCGGENGNKRTVGKE